MSRYYSTGTDPGLSRQSSKNYKAIRQKSNAELNEKLRRLDIEHNTNIAKILNERYDLRTIHYNLTHSGGESSSDSDSEGAAQEENGSRCVSAAENEDVQSAEKKVQASVVNNSKKQTFLQLPSIIEGSPIIPKQHSKSPRLDRSPLPPLTEHGFPTRTRMTSESILGNTAASRQRQRSSTLPIGHMPGDRQRQGEFMKKTLKHEKSAHIHNDGKRVGDDHALNHSQSQDEDQLTNTMSSWEKELHSCRYLRLKRHSTPDVLNTEAMFDRIPEK